MDEPLDLSLPKKSDNMMTRKINRGSCGSLFNDIEPLALPRTYRIPTTNLENPAVLEKRVSQYMDFDEFYANRLTSKVQKETARFSIVEPSISSLDSSKESEDETATSTSGTKAVEMSTDDDDDDDDNRSTNSDISLFAPSLSDILDSDIEDSIQVTMNGTNRWNMVDNVAAGLEEKTMDEQIEEIFAMTIKNVPKMVSPIHDPPHLEILSRSNSTTKRQLNEFQIGCSPIYDPVSTEPNGITEPGDAAKRMKCQRSLFDECFSFNHPNESNTPMPESILEEVTREEIQPTQPFNGQKFRSSIDFKNMEKITINADDLNSRRIVTHSKSMENVVDPTTNINSTQPVNGQKFRSSIDFKNLEKITIHAGALDSKRIVTHSESSLSPDLDLCSKEEVNVVPVQHTPPLFEQPLLIQCAPTLLPICPDQNMMTRSQSVHKSALEPLREMKSESLQSTQLFVQSLPPPIDSVRNVVDSSQSALGVLEHVQGMQYYPMQSAKPQLQPSLEQLLTIRPVSIPQPMSSIHRVVTHSQPVMPIEPQSINKLVNHTQPAVPMAPEHYYRMQSVPIPSTSPQFQPSQQSLIQSVPTSPEPLELFEENLVTSSLKQSTDRWLDDDKRRRYIIAALRLFEHPCINFLANKPCAMPISCPYNHQLPSTETILAKMHTYPNEKIHYIYQSFIAKNLPTFIQYFPWVCCLLGIRNMEATLVSSVRDCDKYQKYDYYKYVFGGLLMCGKTDKEAFGKMAEFVDVCEKNLAAMHELMNNPINPFLF